MNDVVVPESELPPLPKEIPWKLAATTQALKAEGVAPADTSLALFFHVPELEEGAEDYPGERPIYLKIAASISPASVSAASGLQPAATAALSRDAPVWAVLLDLRIAQQPMAANAIRPYFHAAAPLRRTMVETGVVGAEYYETAANGVMIGRSGTQVHETTSSNSTTETRHGGGSGGINLGLISLGASGGWTSNATSVTGERSVDQRIEQTNRSASEERRELYSHTLNVENVLTLLSARHVGSPYLQFSLWPRPLQRLSVDPSDDSLWYQQLLHRRSSGIEGIQEFFAVAMVPSAGCEFQLSAELRRVCVIDAPGSVPREQYTDADVIDYLQAVWPLGTPLEDLDVDLTPSVVALENKVTRLTLERPVVRMWEVARPAAGVRDPYAAAVVSGMTPLTQDGGSSTPSQPRAGWAYYKMVDEITLEMCRRDLARSPLERGLVCSTSNTLKSVMALDAEGALAVQSSQSATAALVPLDGISRPPAQCPLHRRSVEDPGRNTDTVAVWNNDIRNFKEDIQKQRINWGASNWPARADELLNRMLDFWKRLPSGALENRGIEDVIRDFGLQEFHDLFSARKVTDLRGLARVLAEADTAARVNARIEAFKQILPQNLRSKVSPVSQSLTAQQALGIRNRLKSKLIL